MTTSSSRTTPNGGSRLSNAPNAPSTERAESRPPCDSTEDLRELVLARRERERAIAEVDSDDAEIGFFDEEEPTVVTVNVNAPLPESKGESPKFPLWAKLLLAILSLLTPVAPALADALIQALSKK